MKQKTVKPAMAVPAQAGRNNNTSVPEKGPAPSITLEMFIRPLILLILFIIAYTAILDDKINLNGDNIYYHLLGKALTEGRGYVNIFDPALAQQNHFPPGYPFLISLFMRLGFTDISFFCKLNGILAFGSIVIFYAWMLRNDIHKNLAFVICLFILLNPTVLSYAAMNMSEVPFLFFSVACLYFLSRSGDRNRKYVFADPYFWLMMASLIITFYTRTTGIALVLAVILFYLFRKKWIAALLTLSAFVLAVLPWQIRSARLGGNDYVHQMMMKNCYRPELGMAGFGDFVHRVIVNIKRYTAMEIPSLILPKQFPYTYEHEDSIIPMAYWIAGLAMTGLIIYGLILAWKRQKALVIYIFLTAGIVLLWPEFWLGPRFILPVLPMLLMGLFIGLDALIRKGLSKIKLPWQPLIFSSAVLLVIPAIEDMTAMVDSPYPPQYKSYFDAAEWARDNLPANSVFCARKPELFYLFAERKCVSYAFSTDDKEVLGEMKKAGVGYVIIDQLGFSSTPKYLVPALQKNAHLFDVVYHRPNPDIYILAFKDRQQ